MTRVPNSRQSVFFHFSDKPSEKDVECERDALQQHDTERALHPMTTRKEIWAWWLYDWANSPMSGVAVVFLYQILVTQMATHYACKHNTPFGCDYDDNPINFDGTLAVSIASWQLKPSSFTSLMNSLSALFQIIAYVSFSALADYEMYQHYLFRITAIVGSLMGVAWLFIDDDGMWLFAGVWAAANIVPYGLSVIFYNAYLPQLIDNHWAIRRLFNENKESNCIKSSGSDSDTDSAGDVIKAVDELRAELEDDTSQYGFMCGYFGTVIAMLFSMILIFGLLRYNSEIDVGVGPVGAADEHSEYWMKPVVAVDCYHSLITDNRSLINGIRLTYSYQNELVTGELFGQDVDTEVAIAHTHYAVPPTTYIAEMGVIFDKTTNRLEAIQFITKDAALSSTWIGTSSQAKEILSFSSQYDDFELAGIKVKTSTGTKIPSNDTFEVISGLRFGFINHTEGQYSSTISLRIPCAFVALWWLVFALICMRYLQKRPQKPVPQGVSLWCLSLKQYKKTVKRAANEYQNLFRFLIAWFIFSDGVFTISSTGTLFLIDEMNFDQTQLSFLFLLLQFAAGLGSLFFIWLQDKLQFDTKQMLILHLCAFSFVALYSTFGLVAPFGMVHNWEAYAFAAVFGMNIGSFQSYSRSFFSHLLPSDAASEFYGLYEFTDKGSSWVGPLMVAIISNYTTMRYGFFYVTFILLVSIPFLRYFVKYESGKKNYGPQSPV